MIRIKKINLHEFIYLTFALDSALKIPVGGFKLHLGVALILLYSLISIFHNIRKVKTLKFLKSNWSIVPFLVFVLIHVVLFGTYSARFSILLYYFIALFVFSYFHFKSSKISIRVIGYFQWLLIISGLFQFLLFKLFGYQLAFFDAAHYEIEGSFATRLRGFFLEPNWFSIVFIFNGLLLFYKKGKLIYKDRVLLIFSFITLLLNGSYGLVVVVFGVSIMELFQGFPIFSMKRFKIIIASFVIGVFLIGFRTYNKAESSTSNNKEIAVNYGSRLLPAVRTTLFMMNESTFDLVLGKGLGAWAPIGLEENSLGYVGMSNGEEKIITPSQRDSAEYHVFLLEFGIVGILLYLFDYLFLFFKYRRTDIILAISMMCMLAAFFVYPIYKFNMYLAPLFLIRSFVIGNSKKLVI
ncbi:hypothetical protein [Aureibacter tunicatorum]|uniref:Uncharacterized protein n=1 Tax=Aureibacter tunicatorum TaxID=866807 RepID=A0AAE3XPA9_9BACT|nr:hypothetical protein [Aureibacter tunicatorum]MDR6240155.1 hypothetical protein [Aureibacter tunicatorum]BDD05964.1 hypothetical protein AUTU_34470 [Aureibacter tunicatorum]